MIKSLKNIVGSFFKNEFRRMVKKPQDSYLIKIGNPAFLVASLIFGILSAARDCPKKYDDNGIEIPTSWPLVCAWPIFASIVNGINLLYKVYELCAR